MSRVQEGAWPRCSGACEKKRMRGSFGSSPSERTSCSLRGEVVDHDRGARPDAEQCQAPMRGGTRTRKCLRAGLLALVGDHDEPVAPHRHRPCEGHDLLAADVARRHVVEQDGPAAAQRDVEDAAGHDPVGRAGSADLADCAEVDAVGTAAHRLGDQSHARPRQPHQVPVQRVDGAPGVAGGGEGLVPRGEVVGAQRLRRGPRRQRERGVEVDGRHRPGDGPRLCLVPVDERQQRAERDERDDGDGQGHAGDKEWPPGSARCGSHDSIVRPSRPRGSPRAHARGSGRQPPPST